VVQCKLGKRQIFDSVLSTKACGSQIAGTVLLMHEAAASNTHFRAWLALGPPTQPGQLGSAAGECGNGREHGTRGG
jgi:hypothetical protein